MHHGSPFDAGHVGLCEVAYYFGIVTAVLARLDSRRQQPSPQSPSTHGNGKEVEDSDDLNDEKFVANLEHLLRCLAHSLYGLLIQKTIELLDLEALYRQQHLDDGLFAEKPGRRQRVSSTWPWAMPTALLVLWGVCWMFFDSLQKLSKPWRTVLLDDQFWECWDREEIDLHDGW